MTRTADQLKTILLQEIDGFITAVEKAEEIRSSIFRHDWKRLSQNLERMEHATGYIAALEKERSHVFSTLRREVGEKSTAGFYTVIVHLDAGRQEELSKLFRQLKSLVLQLQGSIWSIDAYTRTLSTTIYDILQEMFPHRRGTMYSKTGRKQKHGSDPLVVNRQL
ncbi:MAG: hypothetical protein SVR04_11165 [Spirochaetota bacterium]|jgi:hypothetical protein|nr:hypothetical protein [Spirochaetota bacterium]